ncbi:FG-GAP repeat domain-containing protein [Poriferisphaera sp. WC338]|uniref:FG-GAP repeat domain-containing protein n=1 Tax=Poriferisphaera sp. WC338 TaxID=3425129 RepID=UPI003D8155CB
MVKTCCSFVYLVVVWMLLGHGVESAIYASPDYTCRQFNHLGEVIASYDTNDFHPRSPSNLQFDGDRFYTWKIDDGLQDRLEIQMVCRVETFSKSIGGNLLSAFQSNQPAKLLWAVRTNGEYLELVRWDSHRQRYRSAKSRYPVKRGQWMTVKVELDDQRMLLSVDEVVYWRSTWFGSVMGDRITVGAQGDGRSKDRRFRGGIKSLSIQSFQSHTMRQGRWKNQNVVFVDTAQKDSRFSDSPIQLRSNLRYFQRIWPQVDVATLQNNLKIYRWDDTRNQPISGPVPYRFNCDHPLLGSIDIGWLDQDAAAEQTAVYALVIDDESSQLAVNDQLQKPTAIPMIGGGETLSVGRSDLLTEVGQHLAGYPSAIDWDLDGDLDLLVASVYPRNVVMYENIAKTSEDRPVLVAPRIVNGGRRLKTHDFIQRPDGQIIIYQASRDGRRIVVAKEEHDGKDRLFKSGPAINLKGLPEGAKLFDVHAQDVNGDGVVDVLLSVLEGVWWWPDGKDPWHEGKGNPRLGYGKGYDTHGKWLGKAPTGSFWVAVNKGSSEEPVFDGVKPITMYGEPIRVPTTQLTSAMFDVDADGDLDLLAAVGVDQILVYEKQSDDRGAFDFCSSRNALKNSTVSQYSYFDTRFELVDWNRDGEIDVLMGSNPGLVVLCTFENGKLIEEGVLQVRGANVWAEPLLVPWVGDVTGDGKWDVVTGDCSGYLSLFENIGEKRKPLFDKREQLRAGGEQFRPIAGYSGSIQGPNEARWGYLVPAVADWDGDGMLDIVSSDITGKVYWLRNEAEQGSRIKLQKPEDLVIDTWPMKVRWRTRPAIVSLEADKLPALVTNDEQGYLALYRRDEMVGPNALLPGERLMHVDGSPIKIDGPSGFNGRAKLVATDWDRDGDWDLLVGQHPRIHMVSEIKMSLPRHHSASIVLLRNEGTSIKPKFAKGELMQLANGQVLGFGNHSCAPAVYDVDGDGWEDLFVGTEVGFVHYFHRSMLEDRSRFMHVR